MLRLVYYQADDTVLCDSAYIVKGARGRILWAMLISHADSGRTQFTTPSCDWTSRSGFPPANDDPQPPVQCAAHATRVGRQV